MSRIRGAFAVPKKGETFELRAGLVYGLSRTPTGELVLTSPVDLSMHMNGMSIWLSLALRRGCTVGSRLMRAQKGVYPEDHHGHDVGQGCLRSVPGCPEEHRD